MAVARVKGRRAGGTPNMAAARAVARGPGAEARRPPSLRAARLLLLLAAVAAVGPREGGAARLYRVGVDAVWLLDSGSVRSATGNSSAAWLVQFHSSWCGHCIGYAPTWRALAADVRDWSAAIRVAALDCAEEKNQDVCRTYDIHFYPTFRVSPSNLDSAPVLLFFTRGFWGRISVPVTPRLSLKTLCEFAFTLPGTLPLYSSS